MIWQGPLPEGSSPPTAGQIDVVLLVIMLNLFEAVCSASPLTPLQGRSAWYASDYQNPESFAYRLTETDIAELEAAADNVGDKDTKVGTQCAQIFMSD